MEKKKYPPMCKVRQLESENLMIQLSPNTTVHGDNGGWSKSQDFNAEDEDEDTGDNGYKPF